MTLIDDTIFALSSGSTRAGVAVVRLSGPEVRHVLERFCAEKAPIPRKVGLKSIKNPQNGEIIDQGLVIFFEGPASFTGEDCAEFQVHGSRAVIQALSDALIEEGLRPAEAGEFSRRAFNQGKLDLTEIEGLGDLIDAETEAQRRQALRQMDGELGRLYEGWRSDLLRSLAHVEAELDFPDEDLPEGIGPKIIPEISRILGEIDQHLADKHRGERLRAGYHIVILGAPNVGKSSLLNALATRDVAIVSSEAGTTRDVLEAHLDIHGFPVCLSDTAGLRESSEAIESEGIRRAHARAEDADLRILLIDAKDWPERGPLEDLRRPDDLIVINKVDLMADGLVTPIPNIENEVAISVKSGAGIDDLIELVGKKVENDLGHHTNPPLTRQRHRTSLIDCRESLKKIKGIDGYEFDNLEELLAEELRIATRALGRITGRVDVEDLLDIVFKDFCIGK